AVHRHEEFIVGIMPFSMENAATHSMRISPKDSPQFRTKPDTRGDRPAGYCCPARSTERILRKRVRSAPESRRAFLERSISSVSGYYLATMQEGRSHAFSLLNGKPRLSRDHQCRKSRGARLSEFGRRRQMGSIPAEENLRGASVEGVSDPAARDRE